MSAATLAQRYEQVRGDVLAGMALTARRWGLHLLLTRGMAAWMRAWSAMDDAATATSVATRNDAAKSSRGVIAEESATRTVLPTATPALRLPAQFQQQMTSLVADMILQQSPILT